ncbi:MAG: metallopeptidase family protein [Planctomycetota bacterium]
MLEELDRLAEQGMLDELVARASTALPGATDELRLELHHYLAWAWFEMGDFARSLEHARLADDPLDESKALFHLWRLDEARAALADCGDEAEAHWYRSLVAEFTGGDARPGLRRAVELAPERYHLPPRLDKQEMERVVRHALGQLPSTLEWIVQEAVILIHPLPEPHPDVDPLSLGLYVGQDITQRSVSDGMREPSRIEIYQQNIERVSRDADEAAEELRITLLHEMGHHFGFDEDGVERLGLA